MTRRERDQLRRAIQDVWAGPDVDRGWATLFRLRDGGGERTMNTGGAKGQIKNTGFGEWEECGTEVTEGNGLVTLSTYALLNPPKERSRIMLTAEEAGRLGLALLAGAREGGWNP